MLMKYSWFQHPECTAEQAEQLEQNKAQLRTMALLLSNSGMSVEEIAKSVGMSQDQVKLLLNK